MPHFKNQKIRWHEGTMIKVLVLEKLYQTRLVQYQNYHKLNFKTTSIKFIQYYSLVEVVSENVKIELLIEKYLKRMKEKYIDIKLYLNHLVQFIQRKNIHLMLNDKKQLKTFGLLE